MHNCPHCKGTGEVDSIAEGTVSCSASMYGAEHAAPEDLFRDIGLSRLDLNVPAITEPVPGSTINSYPTDVQRRSVFGEAKDNIQPHNNAAPHSDTSSPVEPESEKRIDNEVDELFVVSVLYHDPSFRIFLTPADLGQSR